MNADDLISIMQNHWLLGYALILIISIPEGPVITVICGFLITRGLLDPLAIYCVVIAGDVVGDSFWYALGRFGISNPHLEPFTKYLGISPERLKKVSNHMKPHTFKILALGKFLHGLGVIWLIVAGASHAPYRRYVATCLFLSMGQSAILLALGVIAGTAYEKVAEYLNVYAAVGSVIAITIGGVIITKRLLRMFWLKKAKPKTWA